MELETYGSRRGRTIFLALRQKLTQPKHWICLNMARSHMKSIRKLEGY